MKQLVSTSSKQKSAGACSAWVPWAAWLVGYRAGEEEPLLGSPASTNLGMKVRGIFWAESWGTKQQHRYQAHCAQHPKIQDERSHSQRPMQRKGGHTTFRMLFIAETVADSACNLFFCITQ